MIGLCALAFGLVWYFFIASELTKLPKDFEYQADLVSRDNFYDPELGDYIGPIDSQSHFYYKHIAEIDGVHLIENIFTVRTPAGDKIFSASRLYGIDPYTQQHVAGYGDADRQGYLFGPRQAVQSYTYWHVNYPDPIIMQKIDDEEIAGVPVAHYRGEFTTDQTAQLGNLPGVPEKRGVKVSGILDVWVHIPTGYMVSYHDNSQAVYYDLDTGQEIEPWNWFDNTFTQEAKVLKAREAQSLYIRNNIITYVPTALAALTGILLLHLGFRRKLRKKE